MRTRTALGLIAAAAILVGALESPAHSAEFDAQVQYDAGALNTIDAYCAGEYEMVEAMRTAIEAVQASPDAEGDYDRGQEATSDAFYKIKSDNVDIDNRNIATLCKAFATQYSTVWVAR